MMEEAPADEPDQWASFSSFDFTQITPVTTQPSGQWLPIFGEDVKTDSQNGQLEQEHRQSHQPSLEESLVDFSDDAGWVAWQLGPVFEWLFVEKIAEMLRG